MRDDFSKLKEMEYSGRGITLGMTREECPFVGYTLTGRSPSSQARKLVYDESELTIRTEVTDIEQLKKGNPALLIYPAIIVVKNGEGIVVSNGAQTKLIADFAKGDNHENPRLILFKSMEHPFYEGEIDITTYEPDDPNFTPRVSGCLDRRKSGFFAVKRVEPLYNAPELDTEITHSGFDLEPGKAKFLTTYLGGNENPLLPCSGVPLEAVVSSVNANEIVDSLYEAIGPKNDVNHRVSAAVMILRDGEIETAIRNRNELGS